MRAGRAMIRAVHGARGWPVKHDTTKVAGAFAVGAMVAVGAALAAPATPTPTATAAAAAAAAVSDNAAAPAFRAEGRSVRVFTTAEGTDLRLSPAAAPLSFGAAVQPPETEISIFVEPAQQHQALLGIGGAITDASAEVFAKLPPAQQQELLTRYYDADKGIGYTWARTTIHSSDFSSASYTYVREGDAKLASFDIAHDLRYRIPLIKRATAAAGGTLTLFASPWSPPAFMKSNGSMLKGGTLLPQFRQPWADYYVKFVQAYEKAGVPVWGLSIQNEPMATQTWESAIWSAEAERDFLRDYLGPTLERAGLSGRKVIVWDHNRDLVTQRAATIFGDPAAAKYAWGLGFHWYETWTGGEPMHANVAAVAQAWPDKPVLLTEASIEKFTPARYQYWPNGERYGRSMINDFNSGAVAWTDWNILLDEHGGPNHVGNYCFAPIHADLARGELVVTPPYWYIGHFSKFIRPGARRIGAASSRSALLTTAFRNLDGSIATVVMNPGDKAVDYNLIVGTSAEAKASIPAHAIQTLVY
jgi:glucosylceramidase